MYYLGIDLGGSNIAAGVIDENYQLLSNVSFPTGIPCTPQELCERLEKAAKAAIEASGVDSVVSAGIGCPGSTDQKNGIVSLAPNLFLTDYPLAQKMTERLGFPVCIDNDANAAAWGEFKAGALQGTKNAIAVTLGTGVGTGILLDGKIYTGTNGAAGEFGHMVIERSGRPCNCGRLGCWERYASATGLILTTKEHLEKDTDRSSIVWQMIDGNLNRVSGKTAFDAMRAGDALGQQIVDTYIADLSCGIVNLISGLQPDRICIGGGISREKETLLAPLRKRIGKEQFKTGTEFQTSIITAQLGNDAGIIGAALLGLNIQQV